MTTKTVAKSGDSGSAVATTQSLTLKQMVELMGVNANVRTSDPKAVQEEILGKILAADTIDAVFENVGSLTHSDELLGKPVTILSVKYNRSDYADGLGFYAVAEFVDENGVRDNAAIGSTNAMAQLFRLDTLEAFPLKMTLTQTQKPTAQGYYPQFFVKAE